MARKTPYKVPNIVLEEPSKAEDIDRVDTIETLDDIVTLQPDKNAQLAAKKISEKYKKMRGAKNRKNKVRLPGKIVKIETIEIPQGKVKVPVSIPKPKVSNIKTVKKITKKNEKKKSDKYKKIRQTRNIYTVEEVRIVGLKKNPQIAAKKISNKYKKMTYEKTVNEDDVETIDYNNDSDKDMFAKNSIVIAANKISDKYKKSDEDKYAK